MAGVGGGSALSDEISSLIIEREREREREREPAFMIVRVYVTLWEHAR